MIKKILQKIFKKFSYSIFFVIYGKIAGSIDCKEDNRINTTAVKKEKELEYKIYKVTNGRLYTDRIQDTAIILDNKVINQPSFQLRRTFDSKIYNSNIKDNIVFRKGTPRKLINLNGSVLSLLTGGGGNNNYWHWLFDVLPRLALFSKIDKLDSVDYFLLPDLVKKFQIETLDSLKIPIKKRLSSKIYRHIKAEKIISTDHPVVVTGNATKDIMNIPFWISEWLRESFLKEIPKNEGKNIKNIYIDRSFSKSHYPVQRLISNEEEVKKYLLNNKFTSIKLHETSFLDQVNLFNNAECIVGLHGGGFANTVFCRPETKIIELKSSTAGVPIENLAKKNNLNYKSIEVKAKQIENFDYPNQQGAIQIPINELSKVLKN
ncbi:glycosyltransferase family 61 protein [bacterium]|nr:glycosyltransferase family 61 protein [bacterium]